MLVMDLFKQSTFLIDPGGACNLKQYSKPESNYVVNDG
jgi:hypothetical protein